MSEPAIKISGYANVFCASCKLQIQCK